MNKAAVADVLVRLNAFAPFRYLNRSKLPILMYHRFSADEEFGKTSRKTLETHLKYLSRHYRILSLTEAVECLANARPFPPRSAVITIDDGYRDFYDVAFPVFKSFEIPATLYVVTEFLNGTGWIWTDKARYILINTRNDELRIEINSKKFDLNLSDSRSRLSAAGSLNSELKKLPDEEKNRVLVQLSVESGVEIPETPPAEFGPMDWDKARDLIKDGIEVGSHTVSHPILTNVDEDRLRQELAASKTIIQERLQRECIHFCYPNGNVSPRESAAAAAAGYTASVTTEVRLCENGEDPFLMPRIDAEPEMYRFIQATSGFDRLKTKS